MNKKFEIMWKEAVIASFETLPKHVLGKTEEDHNKPDSITVPGPRFEPGICQI
jgi:hypothetical protein